MAQAGSACRASEILWEEFAASGGGGQRFRLRASNFFPGGKVTKKPLRTYGSKDSLIPTGVRTLITGARVSRGPAVPPRALRPLR